MYLKENDRGCVSVYVVKGRFCSRGDVIPLTSTELLLLYLQM